MSVLSTIIEAEWQALVLVNTCQSSSLQSDVSAYLDRATSLEKMILLTISGDGQWQPEIVGIDSLTSASRKARVQPLVTEIVHRLDGILDNSAGIRVDDA